jgi:hypothetical protein
VAHPRSWTPVTPPPLRHSRHEAVPDARLPDRPHRVCTARAHSALGSRTRTVRQEGRPARPV